MASSVGLPRLQDFEAYYEARLGVRREPAEDGDDGPQPRGSDHLAPAARTSPSSSSSSGWCWCVGSAISRLSLRVAAVVDDGFSSSCWENSAIICFPCFDSQERKVEARGGGPRLGGVRRRGGGRRLGGGQRLGGGALGPDHERRKRDRRIGIGSTRIGYDPCIRVKGTFHTRNTCKRRDK